MATLYVVQELGVGDLPKICVACLKMQPKMMPVTVQFLHKLFGASNVLDEEIMPDNMCTPCYRQCNNWINFQDKFIENSLKLKDIIEQSTTAIIPYEEETYTEVDRVEKHVVVLKQEDYDVYNDEMDVIVEEEEEEEQAVDPKMKDETDGEQHGSPTLENSFDLLFIECALCSEAIPDCLQYNQHLIDQHMEGDSGKCPQCPNDIFPSEDLFRKHIYGHTKFKFNCPECTFKFCSRHSLNQHMRIQHKNSGAVKFRQCPLCAVRWETEAQMRSHILKAHVKPNQEDCFMCQHTSPSEPLLALHIYSHAYSNTSVSFCEICGKSFHSKDALQRHMKYHDGLQEKYECQECGKSYASQRYLDEHSVRHVSERNIKCNECGHLFYTERELKNHLKQHSKDSRSYICKYCGRGFLNNSTRSEHVRIRHTGERGFPCEECGRSYFRKRELVEHQRSHTGEKPFSCELCGKIYARKTTLLTHMKTHR